MDWLSWALLGAATYSAVNVVDKVVVARHVRRPEVFTVFIGLFGLVPMVTIWFAWGLSPLSAGLTGAAVLAGFIRMAAVYAYLTALVGADAPVVVALMQLTPVFSVVLGHVFLGESFQAYVYLGMALTILGALGVSFERRSEKPGAAVGMALSSAFWVMVAASLLLSVTNAIQDYTLQSSDLKTIFFWVRLGDVLGSLAILCLPGTWSSLRETVTTVGKRVVGVIMVNEAVGVGSHAMVLAALAAGPLSLVATCVATQPFFVLIFSAVINDLRPGTVPQTDDPRYRPLRLAAMLCTVVGVYYMSLQ